VHQLAAIGQLRDDVDVRVGLVSCDEADDVRVRQVCEHGNLAGEVLERILGGELVDDLDRALAPCLAMPRHTHRAIGPLAEHSSHLV
jgi:hypothetical protein